MNRNYYLPTTSVLPVRKVTMSPGVKGSLKSSNMPPKKLAAISLGEVTKQLAEEILFVSIRGVSPRGKTDGKTSHSSEGQRAR